MCGSVPSPVLALSVRATPHAFLCWERDELLCGLKEISQNLGLDGHVEDERS